MKSNAQEPKVQDREDENLKTTEKVANGEQQFQYILETNPKIKDGLTWFKDVVTQWDTASVEIRGKHNRAQHGDAWALQRDCNYLYSDRKRLMEIGHDTRFESAYNAIVKLKLRSLTME